jgi:hypothetical protein
MYSPLLGILILRLAFTIFAINDIRRCIRRNINQVLQPVMLTIPLAQAFQLFRQSRKCISLFGDRTDHLFHTDQCFQFNRRQIVHFYNSMYN